jgi:hypothetical protein
MVDINKLDSITLYTDEDREVIDMLHNSTSINTDWNHVLVSYKLSENFIDKIINEYCELDWTIVSRYQNYLSSLLKGIKIMLTGLVYLIVKFYLKNCATRFD